MSPVAVWARSSSERWVLAWVDRYTRGVPSHVAGDRRDELRSDLWEQVQADGDRPTSELATAISILSRTVRGIPSDLSWRRAQLAGRPAQPFRNRFVNRVVPAGVVLAAVVGVMLASIGVGALGRIGVALARHEFPPSDLTVTSTALGTLGLVCGLLLMLRSRTRWIGAIWLAASAAIVLSFGGLALVTLSATVQWFAYRLLPYPLSTLGQLGVIAAIASVSLFYLLLAIGWIPRREERR